MNILKKNVVFITFILISMNAKANEQPCTLPYLYGIGNFLVNTKKINPRVFLISENNLEFIKAAYYAATYINKLAFKNIIFIETQKRSIYNCETPYFRNKICINNLSKKNKYYPTERWQAVADPFKLNIIDRLEMIIFHGKDIRKIWSNIHWNIKIDKTIFNSFKNDINRYFWLENILVHEMFHTIGLCHSLKDNNIMSPYWNMTEVYNNNLNKYEIITKLIKKNKEVIRMDEKLYDQWLKLIHEKEWDDEWISN